MRSHHAAAVYYQVMTADEVAQHSGVCIQRFVRMILRQQQLSNAHCRKLNVLLLPVLVLLLLLLLLVVLPFTVGNAVVAATTATVAAAAADSIVVAAVAVVVVVAAIAVAVNAQLKRMKLQKATINIYKPGP